MKDSSEGSTSLAVRIGLLLVSAAIAGAFLTNFCDLVYGCGCRAPWAGLAEHCNIQQAGPPDCPWCSYGWWGLILPLGAIVLAQGCVTLWPGRPRLLWRAAGALAAFPVVGGVMALVFGVVAGYWR